MEKAKAAIQNFTSKHGHHTDVEEHVKPSVTSEIVKPRQHEETTQAVDREVHQDHYHATVQPLQHQEVLPEKHHAKVMPTEHREFHHDNEAEIKERLAAEAAQFKDTSTTHQTQHSQSVGPTVEGEHVHHHVHEMVQPVVQKETIKPEVIHTTVPIHETHHAAAQHHDASVLPTKTLEEFERGGGNLRGNQRDRNEQYEGCPKPYNPEFQRDLKDIIPGHHSDGNQQTASGIDGTSGAAQSGIMSNDGTGIGRRTAGSTTHQNRDTTDTGGIGSGETSVPETTGTNSSGKPSLMSKLNPLKDSDGDGKRGFND